MKLMAMRSVLTGMAAALALSFAGMAAAEVDGLNQVDPDRGFARVWRAYTDMDARFVRDGTPRSAAQMRGVAIGQTKAELTGLTGQPVSANRDGSWNFNIKLPLPQRNQLVCQYRVYFDDDERVTGSVWRRPQCADIVTGTQG